MKNLRENGRNSMNRRPRTREEAMVEIEEIIKKHPECKGGGWPVVCVSRGGKDYE